MREFDLIRQYFAPLTNDAPEACGLADDAARLENGRLIVTKDAMIAGVHFLARDPLDLVARKLLRVNLSDLAAKGAKPAGYFLACVWPANACEEDVALFARGLREDQDAYGLTLYGGDTARHRAKSAPLTLTATMIGTAPKSGAKSRAGAQAGDDLYVSGTIGDAGLGLKVLRKELKPSPVDRASLAGRYHLPEPRLALGAAIAGLAHAVIDVSDGLLADAGRLAAASGARVEIEAIRLPRSPAAAEWLARQPGRWRALTALASFGDDYELLFAAPASMRRSVAVAADASRASVTRIGTFKRGEGVSFLDESGRAIDIAESGYDHFGG